MARALTAGELNLLRNTDHYSQIYLAIHNPVPLYTALAVAPTSNDSVAEISYYGGFGTLANVLPDMTMYVGTSLGAYDKGIVRIRKAPTASVFYIGEESHINWQTGDYITVVNEFGIWAKHWRVFSDITYIDYDVAYSDQHKNCDPVPVLGPDQVLQIKSGSTVSFSPDASNSWVLDSTITGYSWVAPGCQSITGNTTTTPTITYDLAGFYLIGCTVTAANGKSFTGYRNVFVYNDVLPPIEKFNLTSCAGDYESGGWEFNIMMWDNSELSEVRDRARVILFAKDMYGTTEQSIGPITGYEHIIAEGWIDGESIDWNPRFPTVSFTVKGPQFWINKISGFPAGVIDTSSGEVGHGGDATKWEEFKHLTIDKGMWTFLHWRTTVTRVMDLYPTLDTRYTERVAGSSAGSLWAQLKEMVDDQILAKPCCDRYGRMYFGINQQFIPEADRGSIPVVQHIDKMDWRESVGIDRRVTQEAGMLDLSGIVWSYLDGGTGTATPLFSRANGNVFGPYGSPVSVDKLLLVDQSQANTLSGLIYGNMNGEFPSLNIKMRGNYRGFDVTPNQYLTFSCGASENNRGVTFANQKIIPRRINYSFNPENGLLLVDGTFETETYEDISVTIIKPEAPLSNETSEPSNPSTPTKPSPNPINPPVIPNPPKSSGTCLDPNAPPNPATGYFDTFMGGCIYSEGDKSATYNGHDNTFSQYYPCWFRAKTALNPTAYKIRAIFQTSALGGGPGGIWVGTSGSISSMNDQIYSIEALNTMGNVVAVSVPDALGQDWSLERTGKFSNSTDQPVNFLRLKVNPAYISDNKFSGTVAFDNDWGLNATGYVSGSISVANNPPYYMYASATAEAQIGNFVAGIIHGTSHIFSFRSPDNPGHNGNFITGTYHVTGYGEYDYIDSSALCFFSYPSIDNRSLLHYYIYDSVRDGGFNFPGNVHDTITGSSTTELFQYIDEYLEITSVDAKFIDVGWMCGEVNVGGLRLVHFNGWAKIERLGGESRVCLSDVWIKNVCERQV